MNKENPLEKNKKEFGKCETEKTDLSWVRPGAHVVHMRYGKGLITDFLNDNKYVHIRFSTSESTFIYPYVFEKGIIKKYVSEMVAPEKQKITLAKVGEKVTHKTFGEGIVEMIEEGRIGVKFGEIKKTFQFPMAFNNGFLVRINTENSPSHEQLAEQIPKTISSNLNENNQNSHTEDELDSRSDAIKDPSIISQIVMYYVNSKRWRDYLIFVLGINLGLKAKLFLQLKYSDLIDNNGKIRKRVLISEQVARCENKKRKYYVVLNSAVREALNLYIKQLPEFKITDYLFRSESNHGKQDHQPLGVSSLYRILKGTVDEMNLNINISISTLRKTFAYHHLIMNKDEKYQYIVANSLHYRTLADLLDFIGTTENEIRLSRNLITSSENYYFNGSKIIEEV